MVVPFQAVACENLLAVLTLLPAAVGSLQGGPLVFQLESRGADNTSIHHLIKALKL